MSEGFKGNPLLKKTGVQIQFTQEMIEEYTKCMLDPVYFCEKYVKIVHVDRGLIPFKPYEYQKKMMKTAQENRFMICKLPRQCGKTISVGNGIVLHHILFQKDKKVAILANKGDMARKILADIKKSYEHLPKWLQQGIIEWNKTSIELENGSKIVVSATSGDAARGDSYSMVILDEFAFIGENQADEFFKSVYPTISSGKTSKMIIISTPHGMNHFYRMWVEAIEKRSEFVPIEINWWDTPGRDEEWKEQQIRNTSKRDFEQEFECVHPDTIITVKHKETQEIQSLRIIDFFEFCCGETENV